jgi:hypothetical protein
MRVIQAVVGVQADQGEQLADAALNVANRAFTRSTANVVHPADNGADREIQSAAPSLSRVPERLSP